MIRVKTRAIIAALSLLFAASVQARDSIGTEFIFAFQNNHPGTNQISLLISGEQDTEGLVEVPGLGIVEPFSIVAGLVTRIQLPTAVSELAFNGSAPLGVRVTAGAEVSVHGLNRQAFTTDAFTALPVDALADQYIAMSYDGLAQFGSFNLTSEVAVVATQDNTSVQILPSAQVGTQPAGLPFSVTLDRYDVYQINTRLADLTGSRIVASAPVAVMGGHRCADVPSISRSPTGARIGWCDHISEMIPPLETWGRSFVTVPLASRLNGDIVRILAAENGTLVEIDGLDPVALGQGEFFETVLTQATRIEASGPVLISQYAPGQAFDDVAADPFMMLIAPNEQFLSNYTFGTPTGGFNSNFLNIVIPTLAVGSVLLDGTPIDAGLFSVVGNSSFSGAQVPIAAGSHTIRAAQAFGIYVYGFNAYDSYGYPGGMALAQINPLSDSFPPNIGPTRQIGQTLLGSASDNEDLDANGVLDPGEDVNGNGVLDRRSEDGNRNGVLDPGEDANGNGVLDQDRSIFRVELAPGAINLELRIISFQAGRSGRVDFRLDLIEPTQPGSGSLEVEDLAGNISRVDVLLPTVPALGDVSVISTVSGDRITVDTNSFSRAPFSIDFLADRTLVEWRFDSIPADQIEELGYDVVLRDPVAGEQRVVTQRLRLSYINAPGGQRVVSELGAQTLLVGASVFDVALQSDRANYGPNDLVNFQARVTNIGTIDNRGSLQFVVEDSAGTEVIRFAPTTFGPLPPGSVADLTRSWDTGLALAGPYRLHALVTDASGALVKEAFSPFSIVNSTAGLPVITVGVVTGIDTEGAFIRKDRYHTSDLLQVQTRIVNDSTNTLFNGADLRLALLDPNGQEIFSRTTRVGAELVPGAVRDLLTNILLDNATQGVYRIEAVVTDATSQATIASSSSELTVLRDLALAVSGEVDASFAELLLGDTQVCSDTINNLVADGLSGLRVLRTLVNVDALTEVNLAETLVDLAGAGSTTLVRNEPTSGVAGNFACVLSVDTGSAIQPLGFATFGVFNLIADPGLDRTALVGQIVNLDAGASREATGQPLAYRWRFLARPLGSIATIDDPGSPGTAFFVDEQGRYVVELVVNNGIEDSLPKRVIIDVPNRSPQANAGPDQSVSVGQTALLNAAASNDADGDTLAFRWTIVRQPPASLAILDDPNAPNPTLPIDVAGVYEIQLVVNDGFVDSPPDAVILNVGNVAPIANAGTDILALIGDVITLDGSASTDANGDQLGFRWFFESIPSGSKAVLANNGAVRPTFAIDLAGNYVVRLTVNDGLEDSDPDTVTITVGNAAPIANAGPDRSGLAGQRVFLDGGASSDANGDPLQFRWNLLARPPGSAALLSQPLTATPSFVIDVQGDYLIQLIVNDGQFDSRADTLLVTASNLRPIADARFNQPGVLFTGDTVTLDGSGSFDPEGAPLTFRWEFVDRPDGSNALIVANDTAAPSFVIDRQGDYIAQLVVNDGQIDSDPQTVLVAGAQACLDNLSVRPKHSWIQLNWTLGTETAGLEIERSLSLDGPYEVVATTDGAFESYIDSGLTRNVMYYYRVRGLLQPDNLRECQDVGEGVNCGGEFCFFDEVGVNCGGLLCEVVDFRDFGTVLLSCDQGGRSSATSCSPLDFLCQDICAECGESVGCILESGLEDPSLCQAPVNERSACTTQVIASMPVGRVRIKFVPDLFGLDAEQARSTLLQSGLGLGQIEFERTTAVPAGQVIRQDAPRRSVLPQGTLVDIVLSTRGGDGP